MVFVETLRGSYFEVDQPEVTRVCEVAVHVKLRRPTGWQDVIEAELSGTATFEKLATQRPITGVLRIQLRQPRHVTYLFTMQGDNGQTFHFSGAKHPSLMRPIYTATTLWGTLSEGTTAKAMVRLHFDLRRDLVAFVQSLRRPTD